MTIIDEREPLNKEAELINDGAPEESSYVSLFKGVATTGKELIQNEVNLIKEELKQSLEELSSQIVQVVMFGVLFGLTLLPFLAFCVIGLGKLLDDRYWLSSLIVAVICGLIGGIFTLRAYKNVKGVKLSRSAASVEKSISSLKEEITQ